MEDVLHRRRNWRGRELHHLETRRRQDEENLRDTRVERRDIYSSYSSLCLSQSGLMYDNKQEIFM